MIILLSAIALLIIGIEITLVVWPPADSSAPGTLERVTMAAVVAFALWLGSTWALALLRQLTITNLTIRAVILTIVAVVLLLRRGGLKLWSRNRLDTEIARPVLSTLAVAGLLVTAWLGFVLWRGVVVPPLSHDALSYHLPKAVLFARAEGFRYLTELEPRQRNIPANYEMLLTELIVTQKSDTFTEWPSAVFYVLFVIASGAVVERWWGRRLVPPLVLMLVIAGTPVLLLHSGAHKNDVMIGFFLVAAMVFAGRFWRDRSLSALVMVCTAFALAIGTKPQAAALAIFLAPCLLFRALPMLRWRALLVAIVFSVAAFFLLGGVVYAVNFFEQRALMGKGENSSDIIAYGDWENLWQGPYVLLTAPFSRDAYHLYVPWEEKPWFWRKHEIYFSHLGLPFVLCALALPFAVIRFRGGENASERWMITTAAVAAFILMLPVTFEPHGMYAISLPRYVLFIVPVVLAWTLAPLVLRLRDNAVRVVLGVASLFFVGYATTAAFRDGFAPLDYVIWAAGHPGTRRISFDPGRAASMADSFAGPNDKIAIDASYASWIHPVFGAKLSRPVFFIPPGDGPPEIPDDARWVVIDRAWGSIWGIPGLEDLSQADHYGGRGSPTRDELRVRNYLLQDSRFKIRYMRLTTNQLVFRRVQ